MILIDYKEYINKSLEYLKKSKMNIGIIGCGNISDTYFNSQNIFKNLNIIACSDLIKELADKKAKQYNIKSYTVDDLLQNKDVDIVLNLTIPTAHKEIIIKNHLENGKHCFSEKPLAIKFKDGLEIKKFLIKKSISWLCTRYFFRCCRSKS